jgi:hypothetical protein
VETQLFFQELPLETVATIGAGSVVTKDIPDTLLAVGNPAKKRLKFKDNEAENYSALCYFFSSFGSETCCNKFIRNNFLQKLRLF